MEVEGNDEKHQRDGPGNKKQPARKMRSFKRKAKAPTDNFVTLGDDPCSPATRCTREAAGQGTKDLRVPLIGKDSQCTKNSEEYTTGDGIPKQSSRKKSRYDKRIEKRLRAKQLSMLATCSDDEQLGKDGAWDWSLGSPPITESPPIPTQHDAKVTKRDKKRQDTARSDLRKLKLASRLNFGGDREEWDTTEECHGKGVVTFAQGLSSAESTRLHRSDQQDSKNKLPAGQVVGKGILKSNCVKMEPNRMIDLGVGIPENLKGQNRSEKHQTIGMSGKASTYQSVVNVSLLENRPTSEPAMSDYREYLIAENKKNKRQKRLQLSTAIDQPTKRMTIPGGSNKTKITAVEDMEGNSMITNPISTTIGMEKLPAAVRTLIVAAMLAQEENPELLSEKSNKTEKKMGPVWNLKGRSIDDILEDLEILKNDPDIPMPIIEADPASIEDFEQYTRNTPVVETDEKIDDEEEEKIKDAESLKYLISMCGPTQMKDKPAAFPMDLWSFVLNDQKPLVKRRWEGYNPETIEQEVEQLLKELKVSDERKYAHPYFQAQALANVDRFLVKGKEKITPLIHEKYIHKMELIPGTRPRKEAAQKFSETQNAFLKAKLRILEREGRIMQKEGFQKTDWLHRLVLVEQTTKMAAFRLKYGEDVQSALNDPANEYEVSQLYRLTVDCRELNKCLETEPYPMPDINIGKENIIGSRYLSTSDAADAFYTVPIREEDYGKTGFTANGKQYVFKVMLQGGINSARHYARVITETFEGVPRSKVLPFQDDALVHGKNLRAAIENQQIMYNCIRPNNIMLKPSKTRLGYSSTKFLGDIYTPMGRLPDPTRVESIIRMDAAPKTLKEVRHIIGLLVWNIEFIPNGMAILSHLTNLTRKDTDIVAEWKEEVHGKAMDQLKAALASAPCLKPIDVSRPFRVHVDACKNGFGMGAVLLQEHFGQWRPCSYFSRALTPAQRQWSATELEAHALVCAARHWERYLQNGHKWTAIVDHKALIYLVVKRTKTNNTRLLNSVMHLQGHHFDIFHRNGEEHFDADAISRILHSGDIEEAQEVADMELPDDKEVTMKDLRNLNKLLQLRLTQFKSPGLPSQ